MSDGSKAVYIESINNELSDAIENINNELNIISNNSKGSYGDSLWNSFNLTKQNAIENQYKSINQDGTIVDNASAVGVSNLYTCKAGDRITGYLSTITGSLIFAVYDINGTLTHSIIGTGYSEITDISYTFTDSDKYFRIAGAINRISEYTLSYNELPSIIQEYETRITTLE